MSSRTNIFIGCATIFFSTVKFMYTTVQQYLSQYKNINLSTKRKVTVQKIKKKENGQKIRQQYNNVYPSTEI